MRIDTRGILVYIRRGLTFSFQTSYRSARDHPFVLGAMFYLLLLYRLLPSLFGLLVSASPVIVCTALLLGTLLSFGQPNITITEEDGEVAHALSSLQVGVVSNDLVVKRDESFFAENRAKNRIEVQQKVVREVAFSRPMEVLGAHIEREVPYLKAHEGGDQKSKDIVGTSSASMEDKEEIQRDYMTEDREVSFRGWFEKEEFDDNKLPNVASNIRDRVDVCEKIKDLKVDLDQLAFESCFDASLNSPWKPMRGHDASSDSGSDRAESSSSDASMADIIPMLSELHPLLDTELPHADHKSGDEPDDGSEESLQDHESDDNSLVEEDELEEEDEHQEEEAQEEKDDGTEVLVQWTADDEKNLMDLGTSELERNQRLENMIAKRRARKNWMMETEKPLIKLDGNDPVPIMEELSRLLVQIPPVSTGQNPFDLPYDSDGSTGLPGSAPSVMLPRNNPFDFSYDQVDENVNFKRDDLSHQEISPVQPRDYFFRRHESFALGDSFHGAGLQEKRDIRMRPFFVTERVNLEEPRYYQFQRQSSEKSDSKVNSVCESESISSVADLEYPKEQVKQELRVESTDPGNNDVKTAEPEIQFFNGADSVGVEQEKGGYTVGCGQEIDFSASEAIGEEICGVTNSLRTTAFGHETDLMAPDSYAAGVVEEKYNGSNSSSSEQNEKSSCTSPDDGLDEQMRGDSSNESNDSAQSGTADSFLLSRTGEESNVVRVAGPIYDSSPSRNEKPLSYIASLGNPLLYANRGSFNSTCSLASDLQVEVSEMGSPSRSMEKNLFFGGEDNAYGNGSMGEGAGSGNGGFWIASSNLSSVEENESRSREVEDISEEDVIHIGMPEDYCTPRAHMMPELTVGRTVHYLSTSSTDSSDDTMDGQASISFEGSVKFDDPTPYSDCLLGSDDLASSASEEVHRSMDKSAILQSSGAEIEETTASILPPMPEDFVEDY